MSEVQQEVWKELEFTVLHPPTNNSDFYERIKDITKTLNQLIKLHDESHSAIIQNQTR